MADGHEGRDRMARLADAMIDTLAEHPEYGDERCIVLMHDGSGAIVRGEGYEDATQFLADLLTHVKHVFEARGQEVRFIPIPGVG